MAGCVVVFLVLVAVAGPAAGQEDADWPSFQGGPAHLGAITGVGFDAPLEGAWTLSPAGDATLSGAAAVGDLAVATGPRQLVAFDAGTGEVTWTAPRVKGPVVSPALDPDGESVVFVEGEGSDGALVALDTATQELLWPPLPLAGPTRSAPVIEEDKVFVGGRDGEVLSVELASGLVAWRAGTEGAVDTSPAVADGKVFVVSHSLETGRVRMYAFDQETGERMWTFSPPGVAIGTSSVSIEAGVAYAGFGDLTMRAFDAQNGTVLWSTPTRGRFSPIGSPALFEGGVFVADLAGALYRLDPETGRKVWEYQLSDSVVYSAPLVADGTVYVGADDGSIAAVDAASGLLSWRMTLKDRPAGTLAAAGDHLLVPAQGRRGGMVGFRTDPDATPLRMESSSRLDAARAAMNFGAAAVAVLLLLLGLSRLASRPRADRGDGVTAAEGDEM